MPSSVKRYLGKTDASNWDNSVDLYGGGGLQSTTRDLAVFLQALFSNQIYEQSETLSVMLLKSEYTVPLKEYRLGLGYIKGKKSDIEAYMHSGFGVQYLYTFQLTTVLLLLIIQQMMIIEFYKK